MDRFKPVSNELEQIWSALDQSTILAITDKKGVITYVNKNFCEISEYSADELVGQTHAIVNSGFHDRQFWRDLWKQIGSGNTWNGLIQNRAKSGGFYWVETSIMPLMDEKGRPIEYVAIRKDVTDRKRAEEELQVQRDKSLKADKMAALGEISAGIAHELGNPMGALRGRLEMMETLTKSRENLSSQEVSEFCEKAIKIIDRMSLIIRGLQSYSRDASKDSFSETNIGVLLTEVLEFTAHIFRKNQIELKTKGLDQDLLISCRGAEIGQVLVNLVNNACDAIRENRRPWVEVRLESTDTHVEIYVVDCGSGIPSEVKEKIFSPFFTTKPVGSGTGLGLSISKKIAEAHGGTLQVLEEKHTTFRLRIPKLPR